MKSMVAEQNKKKGHEAAAYTVEDVAAKIRALDREVKYLLNKAKSWTPKKPKVTIVEPDGKKKDLNTTMSTNEDASSIPEPGESVRQESFCLSGLFTDLLKFQVPECY